MCTYVGVGSLDLLRISYLPLQGVNYGRFAGANRSRKSSSKIDRSVDFAFFSVWFRRNLR